MEVERIADGVELIEIIHTIGEHQILLLIGQREILVHWLIDVGERAKGGDEEGGVARLLGYLLVAQLIDQGRVALAELKKDGRHRAIGRSKADGLKMVLQAVIDSLAKHGNGLAGLTLVDENLGLGHEDVVVVANALLGMDEHLLLPSAILREGRLVGIGKNKVVEGHVLQRIVLELAGQGQRFFVERGTLVEVVEHAIDIAYILVKCGEFPLQVVLLADLQTAHVALHRLAIDTLAVIDKAGVVEGVGIEDTVAVGLACIDHLEAQQCTIEKILVEQLVAQGSQFGIRPLGQMGGHMNRLRLSRPGRLDSRSLGRRRSRLGATRTGSRCKRHRADDKRDDPLEVCCYHKGFFNETKATPERP